MEVQLPVKIKASEDCESKIEARANSKTSESPPTTTSLKEFKNYEKKD